jgi:hypothetical protein
MFNAIVERKFNNITPDVTILDGNGDEIAFIEVENTHRRRDCPPLRLPGIPCFEIPSKVGDYKSKVVCDKQDLYSLCSRCEQQQMDIVAADLNDKRRFSSECKQRSKIDVRICLSETGTTRKRKERQPHEEKTGVIHQLSTVICPNIQINMKHTKTLKEQRDASRLTLQVKPIQSYPKLLKDTHA